VEGVPEEIEGGDFVGEELQCEEDAGGADDPPVGEEMETGREGEQAGVRQQAESGHGGVDVEPGGEADGYQQGR